MKFKFQRPKYDFAGVDLCSLIHALSMVKFMLQRAAELNGCDRDHMGHRNRNIYYLVPYGKSLRTPELDDSLMLGRGVVWS